MGINTCRHACTHKIEDIPKEDAQESGGEVSGGFPLLSWQIWSEDPQPRVCQPPSKPRAETLPWPAAWAIRPHWGVRPHFKTRARERWEPGQSINTENTCTFTLDTRPNRWRERAQGRGRRVDLHCEQSGDQCTCYNYKNKKPPKSWDESGVQMWRLKWGWECKWQCPQIH